MFPSHTLETRNGKPETRSMRLIIDGLPADVPEGLSLLEILRRRGDPAGHVLVERNGRHVRLEDLSRTFPAEGDVIEVILPAVGG